MKYENLVRKNFSFEVPNPGQIECISKIVEHFELYDHIIIEAPTGIGKSEIAKCVHKTLRNLNRNKFRSTIVTDSKMLQNQYIKDDGNIIDLRGKTNYSCHYDVGPYNSGECRAKIRTGACVPRIKCDYVKQRNYWCNIPDLRVTNHSFQIEACPLICMKPENRSDLIIIDECHEIEENILNHTSIKLVVDDFDIVNSLSDKTFQARLEKIISCFDYPIATPFVPSKEEKDLFRQLNIETNRLLGLFEDKLIKDPTTSFLYGNAIESLQQIQDKFEIFGLGEWMINSIEYGKHIELKPLNAKYVSRHALFRKADKFLHMSSTVCGKDEYCDSLGLDPSLVKFIKVGNPIPEKNRLVYVAPMFNVNSKFDNFKSMGNAIDKIIQRHKDEAGIIHCVSFKLGKSIYENSLYKDRILESSNHKDILNHLSKGGIVISPSIETGFDAKNDLSRFQIIPKIPFAYLGDPFIKLNSQNNPSWYSRRAIIRLVQACGRSIRGVDDYAKTYILDSNVKRLLQYNEELFPDWFLSSMRF